MRVVAAAAGIDSTLLSKLELNQRLPTATQAQALARFFGVPVDEFEAMRIATKFWQDFGNNPAAAKAAHLVREQAAKYRIRRTRRKSG